MPLLTSLLMLSGLAFAQDGTLSVTVTNGTGRIFVDGQDTGQDAPGQVDVPAGNHMVQIKGDCLGAFGQVDVPPNGVAEVELLLEAMGGFVEISVAPDNAKVLLDGNILNMPAAEELACGMHTIQASAPGHVAETREIEVEMGGAYRYRIELIEEGIGSIAVDVDPDKARIFVDGEKVAVGDNTINELSSGYHTIRAELDGYRIWEQRVQVKPDETVKVGIQLEAMATPTVTPDPVDPPDTPAEPKDPPPENRGRKVAGIGLAAAGAAGVGVGALQISQGRSIYFNDYEPAFNGGNCSITANENTQACQDARGLYQQYRSKAAIGGVLMGVGAAALVGGGVLVIIDDTGGYVGFSGSF